MKDYPLNPVPYFPTFPAYLRGLAQSYGPQSAVTYFDRHGREDTHTYQQMADSSLALAKSLARESLSGGKHIAIVSENSYAYIQAFFGITCAGSVAVCVDVEQPDEVICQLIRHADATALFCSAAFRSICTALTQDGVRLLSLEEDLPALIAAGAAAPDLPDPDPLSTAAIIYTSGTTSFAKPVMLSQKNILQNASESVAVCDTQREIFSFLPFYHSYGLTGALLSSLVEGAHYWGNGDLRTMQRDLRLSNPETLIAVPLAVETLYKALWQQLEHLGEAENLRKLLKSRRRFRLLGTHKGETELVAAKEKILGRLRLIISGGAALDPEIAQTLSDFGVLVLQGYGITECAPMIAVNRNDAYNFTSVGVVLPSYDLKFVDGEIWVKGPSVMQGYYKDPEATAEALTDGYFHTGDLGSLDKDGFLQITGRKKNLIVLKNGKKLSPEKLESLLSQIPLVQEVLVYGAATGSSADDVKPAATIYPNPELTAGLSSYEILGRLQREIDKLNTGLPTYQQIQMVSIREKEFEKTASKKIKRYLA